MSSSNDGGLPLDGPVDDDLALQDAERHLPRLGALGEEADGALAEDDLLSLVVYTHHGTGEERVAEDQLGPLVAEDVERRNRDAHGGDMLGAELAEIDARELAEAEADALRRARARDLHRGAKLGAGRRRRVDGGGARAGVEERERLATAELRADDQLATEIGERQSHARVVARGPAEDEAIRRRLGARRAALRDRSAGNGLAQALEAMDDRCVLTARRAADERMLGGLPWPAHAAGPARTTPRRS